MEDKKIFHYHMDKFARRVTWAIIAVIVLVAGWFTYRFFNVGAYMPAWFLTLAAAVAALYILSIPRTIRVTREAFEIHCIVELTRIEMSDFHSIRRIERTGTGLIPLLGSYGFFGYYGYYLDWREWAIVKVYASEWNNLIEITDIYEQRYVVNCDDPEALMEATISARAAWERDQAEHEL